MSESKTARSKRKSKQSKSKSFWQLYKEKGAGYACLALYKECDMDLLKARQRMPGLLKEAHEEGVDVIKFLQELNNALGINNGAGGISTDGNNKADSSQDENERPTATDVIGEGGDGSKETEGSKRS